MNTKRWMIYYSDRSTKAATVFTATVLDVTELPRIVTEHLFAGQTISVQCPYLPQECVAFQCGAWIRDTEKTSFGTCARLEADLACAGDASTSL